MKLPTTQEIEALHRKYAPTDSVFELVFTHCKIVWEIAEQLIGKNSLTLDAELVHVGCLLHDVGVYPLFDANGVERQDLHYITHGVQGEAILKEEGLPEAICRMASHHTGAGLTKLDITRGHLPLPVQDYNAETPEEALVMYADKFHSKEIPPCFNSFDWYKKSVAKFGEVKVNIFVHMSQEFGIPDLAPLIKKYAHAVRT